MNTIYATAPYTLQMQTIIPTYLCPADPGGKTLLFGDGQWTADGAGTSYAGAPTDYVTVSGPSWYIDYMPNGYSFSQWDNGGIIGIYWFGGPQSHWSPVNASSVTDGLSNTALIAEHPPMGLSDSLGGRAQSFGTWQGVAGFTSIGLGGSNESAAAPSWTYNGNCAGVTPFGPASMTDPCPSNNANSFHTSGANFAFGDGSVHFINYSVNPGVLTNLSTRAGGEVNTNF
jgi:prepilin-type processing-associated H-X9-DG protein